MSNSGRFLLGLVTGVATTVVAAAAVITGIVLHFRNSHLPVSVAAQNTPPVHSVELPTPDLETSALGVADYDWELRALDGERVPFSAFRGRVIFLSLWATWCKPCVEELPAIAALRERFRDDENVAFVLFSDEEEDVLRTFAQEQSLDLPLYVVREGIPGVFAMQLRPTTIIIGCDGSIVLRRVGAAAWGAPESIRFLEEQITATCAGREPLSGPG